MKHAIVILFLAFFAGEAIAQNTRGFSLGGHLNGTGWTLDDLDSDTDSGGGLGIVFSYGFTQRFSAFLNLDGAKINPDDGNSYTLGHADLGAQFTFGSSKWRPYLQAALSGRSATVPTDLGDLELSGGGLTGGGGLYYFFSPGIALDIHLNVTIGEFTEVSFVGRNEKIELDATSSRFNIGIRWYPNR